MKFHFFKSLDEHRSASPRKVADAIRDSDGQLLVGSDGFDYVPTIEMTIADVEAVTKRLGAHPDGAWQEYLRKAEAS